MPFVLDASVAVSWHFEDEPSRYADRVLDMVVEDAAIVPSVWPLELANALLIGERRNRLTDAKVARAAALMLELPILVRDVSTIRAFGSILDLARAEGLSTYDAAYLDLAMREGLPLATQDEGLRAAAERVGVELIQ